MKILRMIGVSVGLVGLMMAAFMVMQAPETVQALPPRPEPTINEPIRTKITGGFIELTVNGATSDVWTAVQWQDLNTGDWYLADGWQGNTHADHQVKWYVGKEILGEGPFRWLVYSEQGGDLLVTSDSFDMPERAGQTVEVEVMMVP